MNLTDLVIDESIDRVVVLNKEFKVILWNKACEIVTGIKRCAILDKPIFDVFPELKINDKINKALENALKGFKSFVPHESSMLSKEYVENHFIPLKNDEGEVFAIVIVIHDVAHRIKYEKNIEKLNDELTVKHRQLASLNSELKTFTDVAINSFSETLRQLYLHFEYIVSSEAAKLTDPGKANIRKAQAAIQKMKLLTEDIIAFNKLNHFDSEIQELDLNRLLQTVINDSENKIDRGKVKLAVENLPIIKGYPFLVSLVIHHLLDNAIKFRDESRQPEIKIIAQTSIKGADINNDPSFSRHVYHVIKFIDNGIGFPEKQEENMFHLFTRLQPEKYRGSGTGLAICKKVMEIHNGLISAENNSDGIGSTFSCYFPVR